MVSPFTQNKTYFHFLKYLKEKTILALSYRFKNILNELVRKFKNHMVTFNINSGLMIKNSLTYKCCHLVDI